MKGKAEAGKEWAKAKAERVKGALPGRARPVGGEQAPNESPGSLVARSPLSMAGTGHELTTVYQNGAVSTTLASPDAKSILTIVDNESFHATEVSSVSSEPEKTKQATIASQLATLRPRYDAETVRIRGMADKTKIRTEIIKLNDEVSRWTIDIANRHGLHDFLRAALQLDPVVERIRIQVEDQLEKHLLDAPKPENPGDGHANTATAAELHLLWVHHTDQKHIIKTTTARDVIRQSLDELKSLASLGLDLATIPMYQRGLAAERDCDKALSDPKGYLASKPGLEAMFIADIRRQRAKGVARLGHRG